MKMLREYALHIVIIVLAAMTLLPFVFVLNNSFRTNSEMYHSFFGFPDALEEMGQAAQGW